MEIIVQSNGDGTAPHEYCKKNTFLYKSSSCNIMAPLNTYKFNDISE